MAQRGQPAARPCSAGRYHRFFFTFFIPVFEARSVLGYGAAEGHVAGCYDALREASRVDVAAYRKKKAKRAGEEEANPDNADAVATT